jgi:hypothetical protein
LQKAKASFHNWMELIGALPGQNPLAQSVKLL